MSVTIITGAEVTRPDTTPLKSSVLDHATVVDKSDFGLRSNEGLWASYNCLDLLVPTALCPPEEDPEVVKTFGSAAWVPGFQFAFQGGVECSALGLDKADQQAEVERVFALSEGKGVERALLLNRFVATPLVDPPDVTWEAPVDLTPATAVPVEVALALLEGYAAANYAGVPTIHMPRAAASLLGERIVWEGDKAYTLLGSKVAMGGGYDDADETVVGDWDLYATGEVYVERSESVGVQSYVLPGDGSNDRGFDDNTVLSLAERMFRVGVDCFVAKATGTVWA